MKSAVNCLLVFGLGCVGFSVAAFAAIIGPKDNRMTYQEYANANYGGNVAEVYRKFSAAGNFWCAGTAESGTVVLRNDILIIAAHSVITADRGGQCVQRPNLSQCYFQPLNPTGGYRRKIFIRPETIRVSKNLRCDASKLFNSDWAIVRLAQSATEVTPLTPVNVNEYGSMDYGFPGLKGQKVISFSAQNEDFRSYKLATPAICDGFLGYVWTMGVHTGVMGNFGIGISCSASPGCSGGAIALNTADSKLFYIGLKAVTQPASYNFRPFSDSNFTGGPLLHGEFYDALMGM